MIQTEIINNKIINNFIIDKCLIEKGWKYINEYFCNSTSLKKYRFRNIECIIDNISESFSICPLDSMNELLCEHKLTSIIAIKKSINKWTRKAFNEK